MPASDLSDTQPNAGIDETQPNLPQPGGKRNIPGWLPLLIAVVLIAAGLLAGYTSGMGLRYSTGKTVLEGQLTDQFKLGQQAVEAGQYEVARQHFEFVLNKDSNYPGIKDAMADLLLRMQITPTATYNPAPSVSPTLDTRGAEEQFKTAQDLLKAATPDWNAALAALDSLRKTSPEYLTAQVDGMYYTALYQRGYDEIRPTDCHDTNLNAGINDFTQAEHFGPLDNNALALRIYSRLYIAGASFWDQDWKSAQDLFSQVMAALPTLMDSSCLTASERYRQASLQYAEDLDNAGDACGAAEQYDNAFSVGSPDNEKYFPAATEAADQCSGGGNGGSSSQPDSSPTTETLAPPVETPTAPPVPSDTPAGG